MLRESLVVDGTAKTCKGVIAGLERGMTDLAPGDVVLALVDDIPTRIDVYAWAQRKRHRVLDERRRGSGFAFYIAKGASGPDRCREETPRNSVPVQGDRTDTIPYPEAGV